MIKINIDDTIKTKIEYIHWEWFKYRITHTESIFEHNDKDNTSPKFRTKRINVIKWYLGIKDLNEIKLLVIGEKKYLNHFIKKFQNKFLFEDPSKSPFPNKKARKCAIKNYKRSSILSKAFGYNEFLTSPDSDWYKTFCKKIKTGWNTKILCEFLNINVCPYCNRQYIFSYEKDDKKTTLAEMDHFFPEAIYPYLSCSLYNLIPSCHSCNHSKRDSESEILYPYEDEFGKNYFFRVRFGKKSSDSENLINIRNATVFFKNTFCKSEETCRKCVKVHNSTKTFNLDRIYNEHKIELKDLFDRYRNYCKPKRKDILRLFHEDELKNDIEGLTEKQVDAVLSLYAKKMKNMFLGLPLGAEGKEYPLRKFKEDIIEQLDQTVKNMRK